jgi:hypothetical protein
MSETGFGVGAAVHIKYFDSRADAENDNNWVGSGIYTVDTINDISAWVIYKNDFGLLFQESWEVIFWYLQDLKDEPTRKIIFDFADHHVSTFNSVIENINTMNPI